jgi:hypothetical protein
MIDLLYILNGLSEILWENIDNWKIIYPDLKIANSDLLAKSISIENFEFIDGGKKIDKVYSKGKLEISVHASGKKAKESDLESLIQILSVKLLLNDREPICFYKWEYKKPSGLLKKNDKIVLLSTCNISEAFEKTLEDVINKELPKYRSDSKERPLSEDQLRIISSFEAVSGVTR